MLPSLTPDLNECALLLDVDGTLVPIAPTPDSVVFGPELLRLLKALAAATQGALCLVSGRDHADLQRLCQHLELSCISCHGAYLHTTQHAEPLWAHVVDTKAQQYLIDALKYQLTPYPKVALEIKTQGLAVHYRQAPNQSTALLALIEPLIREQPTYELHKGKCVFELRPRGVNKANAIAQLMRLPPFKGRTPIMFGDDTTDEPAFTWVNQHQGHSIKVGSPSATTQAQHLLPTSDQVLEVLEGWLNACTAYAHGPDPNAKGFTHQAHAQLAHYAPD